VAKILLDREVLSRDDLVQILGKRPYEEHVTFEQLTQEPTSPSPNITDHSSEPLPA